MEGCYPECMADHVQAQSTARRRGSVHEDSSHQGRYRIRARQQWDLLRLLSGSRRPGAMQALQPAQCPDFVAVLLTSRSYTRLKDVEHQPRTLRLLLRLGQGISIVVESTSQA